jgi:hypothetical protein
MSKTSERQILTILNTMLEILVECPNRGIREAAENYLQKHQRRLAVLKGASRNHHPK